MMHVALAGLPLFAAALTAPAAAGGASADRATSYPAATVLDEFARACATLSDLDAAEANVTTAGWTKADPAPDSQAGRLIALGKDMAEMEDAPTRAFRKSVAGRPLDLILSEGGDSDIGIAGRGCRVYDFTATRGIDPGVARAWAGRAPTRTNETSAMRSMVWEPGIPAGHSATQIAFFPQGSAFGAAFHLSGVGLMTQTFAGDAARSAPRESETE